MTMPRFRFTVRGLMVAVAIIALALYAHGLYREGIGARWLLLKLRYGTVAARRAAADEIRAEGFGELTRDVFGGDRPASREEVVARAGRRARQAKSWLLGLVGAAGDPDPSCRAKAAKAIGVLATALGTEADRDLARRHLLVALEDPEDAVREAACGALAGFAGPGVGAAFDGLRAAVDDPSAAVRQAAARSLGIVGLLHKAAQPAVATILTRVLAGRDEAAVRIPAAWGLSRFGKDATRDLSPSGPDVVPALIAALGDPDVEVRRAVAAIFGTSSFAWEARKAAIMRALAARLGDEDNAARAGVALALFALGSREGAVIDQIEPALASPDRSVARRSAEAMERLRSEAGGEKLDASAAK